MNWKTACVPSDSKASYTPCRHFAEIMFRICALAVDVDDRKIHAVSVIKDLTYAKIKFKPENNKSIFNMIYLPFLAFSQPPGY